MAADEAAAAEGARPLHSKLDRVLRQMIGRLGLRDGGFVSDGSKRLSLIPKYVTREQLRTMGVVSSALQSLQGKK